MPLIKRVKLKDLIEASSLYSSKGVLYDLLKEFLNDDTASFYSYKQECLVRAILNKVPFILGILAINGGKSLSYLLTSSLSNSNITVIIIPLIGLKQDIEQRAKEFNISTTI